MGVRLVAHGLQCALGSAPEQVRAALAAASPATDPMRVPGPDLSKILLRRKDLRLLSRPARLGLAAAAQALQGQELDRESVGLFVGVRREPPDEGEADPAIAASLRDRKLEPSLLAGPGRDLYPPLLPLTTLPNMVLAHISINLGLQGPADCLAGGPAAGVQALRAAIHHLERGACPAALVVVADSQVDPASRRDRARLGQAGAAGEAAVALLLALEGSGPIIDDGGAGANGAASAFDHQRALGDCGTADALLQLLLGPGGEVRGVDADGSWARVHVRVPAEPSTP